jgi:hypothetical protein
LRRWYAHHAGAGHGGEATLAPAALVALLALAGRFRGLPLGELIIGH